MNERERILKIRDLDISFTTDNGEVKAVRGVDLDLHKGETIAIVGESGSGKSVTTKAVMGILAGNGHINNGSIEYRYIDLSPERIREVTEKYDGVIPEGYEKEEEKKVVDITKQSKKFIQSQIRGRRIAMVFQDPMTSLDPTMTIGKQVMEAMRFHYETPKKEAWDRAVKLLELVGITDAQKRMKNQSFLNLDYAQFITAIDFLYPDAMFSTEHGVKGEEYDNVVFVIGRGWNQYQFEVYAPMITGQSAIPTGKQASYERNRNLFYVCCSRPKKRLFVFISIPIEPTFRSFLVELVGEQNIFTYSQYLESNMK